MANAEDGHSEAEYVVRRLTASKKGARIQPRLSKSVPKSSPKAAGTPGLSFSVLEAIKPTGKVLAGSGSGESSLHGLQMATFLPCPHMAFS